MSCTNGDVKYDSLSGWYCDMDADALNFSTVPTDKPLSTTQPMSGPVPFKTRSQAPPAQMDLSYDQQGAWVCTSFNAIIDQDQMGSWPEHCNDNDPNALSNADDLDCDGVTSR